MWEKECTKVEKGMYESGMRNVERGMYETAKVEAFFDESTNVDNDEESRVKHTSRSCKAQTHTPSTDLQNCIKTRSLLSFPVLLCSRHGCKNRSKSLKIHH